MRWPDVLAGVTPARARITNTIGLAILVGALLDQFGRQLLLLDTINAGGDTPCHYPTFVFFRDYLLPRFRLHGWYPDSYLGHPLLLYYFPFPFLVMSALSLVVSMPIAFKVGIALSLFVFPLCAYIAFRLMDLPFPAPLLGATAATVFSFNEENPIWGATIASTMTGEFSYEYGTGFALVFLGVVFRAWRRRRSPVTPALALALTAVAHGYAVLWAGLCAAYVMYSSRRPLRSLGWLVVVAVTSFALSGFMLLPLLSDWGWTTPYNDAWITVDKKNLLPPLLWPFFAAGVAGLLGAVLRRGGVEHRVLFLGHAALVAICLALAGPVLGIVDIRFMPFAQLSLCLAGAAAVGIVLQSLVASDLVAIGILLASVSYADGASRVGRHWIDYNYTGLEAKELWPAFRQMAHVVRGTVNDPRVAVEYNAAHEKAGSIRMYEALPFFAGRPTLEGVYNQASVSTHPVYYLASELGASSPNPFKTREFSRFDTPSAIVHLRLFNTSHIVALSDKLVASLKSRADVEHVADVAPYHVFRLRDHGPGYVEPLAYAPVRSSREDWPNKSYRWFTRKPLSRAHVVFTDDPRFTVVEPDPYLPPPEVPLEGGVQASATVEPERIQIRTSRVGHPLLVKVSYHPRWRAEGGDGPYLVSPGLMLVIPRDPEMTLTYGRTGSDWLGIALTLAAAAGCLWWGRRSRGEHEPAPGAGLRWGGIVPGVLLGLLAVSRLLSSAGEPDAREPEMLHELASKAYAAERWADAAEYARGGIHGAPKGLKASMLCLRGESLLRAGEPARALEAFEGVAWDESERAYRAQALAGVTRAARALQDDATAEDARGRLLAEYPGTPWAAQVR